MRKFALASILLLSITAFANADFGDRFPRMKAWFQSKPKLVMTSVPTVVNVPKLSLEFPIPKATCANGICTK